ncbi:hypothetical protein IPA_06230 [Ignicoccus pacificus DSM 13166]|uniref:Uncharacterized protein n=1 Tax=Ignicoccus pacificus DSM 13166 TaxID=940294 RepID=A0A977PK75_9CREN|nr:hypothetical protein IPA_06230 [Ignicoccus pacificus DSM 13166]
MKVLKSLEEVLPFLSKKGIKLAVKELWKGEERWEFLWEPKRVLEAPFEIAIANEGTFEESHYHERSWEIYLFLKGGKVLRPVELEIGEGGIVIFEPGECHLVKHYGPTYVFKFPSGNDKVRC